MFTLRVAKPQPEYVTYRERYKVDLPLQMAECETNYARLNKLLGKRVDDSSPLLAGDEMSFMTAKGEQYFYYTIAVLERSPYTTTLLLSQNPTHDSSAWLQMPRLTVRMYHDAKLAEVLVWEGHKRLRPRYEYPNQAMYQADEKMQINQFLGDWLRICLENGLNISTVGRFSP